MLISRSRRTHSWILIDMDYPSICSSTVSRFTHKEAARVSIQSSKYPFRGASAWKRGPQSTKLSAQLTLMICSWPLSSVLVSLIVIYPDKAHNCTPVHRGFVGTPNVNELVKHMPICSKRFTVRTYKVWHRNTKLRSSLIFISGSCKCWRSRSTPTPLLCIKCAAARRL